MKALALIVPFFVFAFLGGISAQAQNVAAGVQTVDTVAKRTFAKLSDPTAALIGKRLFQVHCARCHVQATAAGQTVGPPLERLQAITDVPMIAEAIIHPSAVIAPEYIVHDVTDVNGASYRGIRWTISGATAQLIDVNSKVVQIPTSTINSVQVASTSLMPIPGHVLNEDDISNIALFIMSHDPLVSKGRQSVPYGCNADVTCKRCAGTPETRYWRRRVAFWRRRRCQ